MEPSVLRYCSFHWSDDKKKEQDEKRRNEGADDDSWSLLSSIEMTSCHLKEDKKNRTGTRTSDELELTKPLNSDWDSDEKRNTQDKPDYETWVVKQLLRGGVPAHSARPPFFQKPGFRYTVGKQMSEENFASTMSRCHQPGLYFYMNPEDIFELVFGECLLQRQVLPRVLVANEEKEGRFETGDRKGVVDFEELSCLLRSSRKKPDSDKSEKEKEPSSCRVS